MKLLTIIESPYREARLFCGVCSEWRSPYLKRCLADSWAREELPFASHGFFPQFLNEDDPEQRTSGILAGYMFWTFAERIAFYIDYGMSFGMSQAEDRINRWTAENRLPQPIRVEYRTIGTNEETENE